MDFMIADALESCENKSCPHRYHCFDKDDCVFDLIYEDVTELAPDSVKGIYRNILNSIKNGENVFLTAPGGNGKSYLLNRIRDRVPSLTITASTGIAALNVGGATLHSTLFLGLANKPVKQAVANLGSYKTKLINNISFLAIDEISMVSGRLLDYCNQFLKLARLNNAPFGGVQVILIGDFCQLPPVRSQNQVNYDFCFNSEAWKELNLKTYMLAHNFRQQEDPEYASLLNNLRQGQITQEGWNLLQSREVEVPEEVPRLYPVNEQVETYNNAKLAQLGKPIHTHDAEFICLSEFIAKNPDLYRKMVDSMRKNSIMVDHLCLCEGARVMITRNLSSYVVNGSLGYVKEIITDNNSGRITEIVIDVDDYGEKSLETVSQHLVGADGKKIIEMRQFPCKLAYAITVHKGQGQTLSQCYIDFERFFEINQAYVALSRVKKSKGLYLKNLHIGALKFSSEVLEFYKSIV